VVWVAGERTLPGAVAWDRARAPGLLVELGGARGLHQSAEVRAGYLGRYAGGLRIVDDGAGITLEEPGGKRVPLVYRGDDEFVTPARDLQIRFQVGGLVRVQGGRQTDLRRLP